MHQDILRFRSLTLLLDINLDRILYGVTIAGALTAGAIVGSI